MFMNVKFIKAAMIKALKKDEFDRVLNMYKGKSIKDILSNTKVLKVLYRELVVEDINNGKIETIRLKPEELVVDKRIIKLCKIRVLIVDDYFKYEVEILF